MGVVFGLSFYFTSLQICRGWGGGGGEGVVGSGNICQFFMGKYINSHFQVLSFTFRVFHIDQLTCFILSKKKTLTFDIPQYLF